MTKDTSEQKSKAELYKKGYSRREVVLLHKDQEIKRDDDQRKKKNFNGYGRYGKK